MTNTDIHAKMKRNFETHFLGGTVVIPPEPKKTTNKIFAAIQTMSSKSYWTKVNTVEAWGFATKIAIIFPGLLFGKQFWWLYVFAIASSVALIWTSTRKTLPTIILFNVAGSLLLHYQLLNIFGGSK